MRPELERLQRIEQQLLGGPLAVQPQEWALRQLLDAELEADAEAQQLVYEALYAAGRRQLRQELQLIHAQLYAPRTGRWHQLLAYGRRVLRGGWPWRLRQH